VSPKNPNAEKYVSANQSILLNDLSLAVTYALQEKEWVVVVFPTPHDVEKARGLLMALLPDGTQSAGRTHLMPGGCKVSIAAANQPVFVPKDTPFTVLFLKWDVSDGKEFSGMQTWRSWSDKAIDLVKTRDVLHGA